MADQDKLNEARDLLSKLTPSDRIKLLKEDRKRQQKERVEKKKSLTILFKKQMETLESHGCPFKILDDFKKSQEGLISFTMDMEIPTENIPFLPVIDKDYLGVYGLVSLLKKEGSKIEISTDPCGIELAVNIPRGLYLIFNVEVGKKMLDKTPKLTRELIKVQNFSPLTFEEGIALKLHGEVNFEHYLLCIGSRIGDHGGVPTIFFDNKENRVEVFYASEDSSCKKFGSPYCVSRKKF